MNRTTSTNRNLFNFSRKVLMASTALVAAGAMTFTPTAAKAVDDYATPTGEQVVGGDISFDRPELGQLNVTQTTDRGYINWGSFNIGEKAGTEFFQPGSGSLTVNKVVGNGNSPTQILGSLKANGQLMVLDQNGVFFGSNSMVDVGGLIASTGDVDKDAIMNGADVIEFTNLGQGTIENRGQITAAEAGLVAFVAPTVKNSGIINAKVGRVAFAAGEKVTLDLYGDNLIEIPAGAELEDALIENAGTINAQGGRVVMSARAAKSAVDSVINMSGVVNASSATMKGGSIVLDGGDKGVVQVSGTVDASGTTGGDVTIDAQNTYLTADSKVDVSSTDTENGTAGSAIMWGRENAIYAGEVDARGKDGFVETSGGNLGVYGAVRIGEGGEWLLDPTNIDIVSFSNLDDPDVDLNVVFAPADPEQIGSTPGTGTPSDSPIDGLNNQDSLFFVWDELINDALNAGGSVTLQTGNDGASEGNIVLRDDAAIMKTLGVDSTLTLEAHHNIILNGTIGASGAGVLNVALNSDYDGSGPTDSKIEINNTITTNGGWFGATAPGSIDVNAEIDATGGSFASFDAPTVNLDANVTANFITGTASTVNVQSDNAEIQDGVDAGAEGATINVAAGTYNESVNAYKANQTLKGANAGTAGFDARGPESIVSPNSPGFLVDADGVTIDGFEVDGGDVGIQVENAADVTLKNNYIHGQRHPAAEGDLVGFVGSGDGIVVVSNGSKPDGVLIEYNLIEDTDDESIQVSNARNITIVSNVLDNSGEGDEGNGDNAVQFNQVIGENMIAGNTIYSGGRSGVLIQQSSNVDVDENSVYGRGAGNEDRGIYVKDSSEIGVSYNLIEDTGSHGIHNNGSDGTQIQGNIITNAGLNGILVNPSNGVVVDANTIDTTGDHGIKISLSDDATVTNNNVGLNDGDNNINGDGIHIVESDGAVVKGNEITGTTSTADDIGSGIQVLDSDGAVIGGFADADKNTIYDTEWDGVRVERVTNTLIQGNDIDNVQRVGVYGRDVDGLDIMHNDVDGTVEFDGINVLSGANVTLFQNTVDNTAEDGITARLISEGLTIDENYVGTEEDSTIGGDGIEVKGSPDAIVTENVVETADENGIYVNGSDGAYVAYNMVSGAALNGVLVNPSSHVEVRGNMITGAGLDGIRVEGGTHNVIDGNLIWDSGRDGIRVTHEQTDGGDWFGTVWVSNNLVDGTGDDGIEVDHGGYAAIYGNTVLKAGFYADNADGNGANGIHVRNVGGYDGEELPFGDGAGFKLSPADSDVYGNTIAFTKDDGIEVTVDTLLGATTYVYDNTVGHIGHNVEDANGILVKNLLESEVYGNVVSSTLNDGIRVENGLYAGIYDNRLAMIGGDGIEVAGISGGRGPDAEAFIIGEPTEYTGVGAVEITYNEIAVTGDNGIYVHDGGATRIIGNDIFMAGVGETVGAEVNSVASFIAGDVVIPPVPKTIEALVEKELVVVDDEDPSFELNWGDGDGILVEDVYAGKSEMMMLKSAGSGLVDTPYATQPYSVVIQSNDIAYTGGDGIEVNGSDRVLIGGEVDGEENIVFQAGIDSTIVAGASSYSELLTTGPFGPGAGRETLWTTPAEVNDWLNEPLVEIIDEHVDFNSIEHDTHDGIHVSNVYKDDGLVVWSDYNIGNAGNAGNAGSAGGEDSYYYGYAVDIIGNDVDVTGDDGIEVTYSSSTLIKDNIVSNAGYGDDSYYGSGDYYGADGIHVRNVSGEVPYILTAVETKLAGSGSSGDGFEEYAVVIDGNQIETTADDGIEVVGDYEGDDDDIIFLDSIYAYEAGTGRTLITGNQVAGAGNGSYPAEDGFGADGIHARGIFDHTLVRRPDPRDLLTVESAGTGSAGIEGYPGSGFALTVYGNDVDYVDDDGIEVLNTGSALIENNNIYDTGLGGYGDFYDPRQNMGGDGITVRNVGFFGFDIGYEEDIRAKSTVAGGIYDGYFGGYAVEIKGNTINNTGDDGIEVSNSASVLIGGAEEDRNTITEVGLYGGGDYYGADGIHVRNVPGGFYDERAYLAGDGYEDYAVVIRNNYINETADDGIEVISDFEDFYYGGPRPRVLSVYDGPYIEGPSFITGRTLIEGNETYNNGVFGDVYEADEKSLALYEGYYGAPDGYGADGIHVRNVGDNGYEYEYSESYDADTDTYTEIDTYTYGARDAVIINDNIVDTTGDDGVEVLYSGRTRITANDIDHSGYGGGEYYGGADMWGADGIHVRGVVANTEVETYTYTDTYNGEYYEYDDDYDYSFTQNSGVSVTISEGNNVNVTEDDGIQVLMSGNSFIDSNIVTNAGYGNGEEYEGPYTIDGNGSDGIHVRTGLLEEYPYYEDDRIVEKAVYVDEESEYVPYFLSTSTVISNNTVNTVADDGIDVEGVTDVLVSNNGTTNVGDDGIEVVGYSSEVEEFGDTVEFGVSEGPTTELPSFDVRILNNTVSNSADNGIKVEDVDTLLVDGNTVSNSGDDGIDIESTDLITVSNNSVSQSSDVGVLIDGLENGSVVLSGNTLSNNDVHARFESGQINLTGAGNSFNGGRVGIQFDGPLVTLIDNDPTDEFDGTLGAQTFTGQSSYYVELTNGALFGPGLPGEPNFYNALNSTYDGLRPSDTNGILTQAQLDFLESKFQHFPDVDTLGLFFFGALDPIAQEDIFNQFGAFNGVPGAAGVTITGLPTISAQQTANLLNNLTPAAGGESGGPTTAEEAAGIEPAAGGENVGCWSDAVNAIDSGATVNYDFDTTFESALSDAAGCGQQASVQ